MKKLIVGCLTGILTLGAALSAPAVNWPAWRGPEATGVAQEKTLPLKWSPTENVRWRVDLPGPGNSSPIAWGDRVFITQAVKADNRRTVICFDRKDGKQLWQSGVAYTEKETTHQTNPYCAASPVTDGERVIASFGSAGLYCFDFAGKELWHRDFGKMAHMFGNAASPMLAGELCILNFGPDPKARLIAVNKKTGETVWEAQPPKVEPAELEPPAPAGGSGGQGRPEGRPGGSGGPADRGGRQRGGPGGRGGGGGPVFGSWSTPILIQAAGREELIVSLPARLCAYEPQTGKLLWFSKGMGGNMFTTPMWGEGLLMAQSSGREGGRVIAVKPGGGGDVTSTALVAWKLDPSKSRTGTGVTLEGHGYLNNGDGNAACIDLKTGKTVWEEQLKGPGAGKTSWSSMLLAGDTIYVPNQSGDVFVLRASPKFELLGVNSVGEPTNASLTASDGELFMRTDKSLWCFGAAK